MKIKWKKVDLTDVLDFAQGKTFEVLCDYSELNNIPSDYDNYLGKPIKFSDGTYLIDSSEWTGPYSEVTPDIDAEPPSYWLGTK